MNKQLVAAGLTFLLLFACVQKSTAQKGYKITVRIEGFADSLALLASYNGDKQFVVDTALISTRQSYIFTGNKPLPEGMYFIAGADKSKLFDFIVSGKQDFTITGKRSNLQNTLSAPGSEDNTLFFGYVKYLADKQKEQSALLARRKTLSAFMDSLAVVENQINLLNDEVKWHISGIIYQHPESFTALFLKSMEEVTIPEAPLLPDGKTDSTFAFRYYKAHFWNNLNLADDRLVRTPFLHSKVELYLNKLTIPAPDSLVAAIDYLFKMTQGNAESFKYLMWYLTIRFESSEIMGYDAIFVHLVDTYYNGPNMEWMNPTVKQNLEKRAKTLKPLLIGKQAPEMILLDTLRMPRSLTEIAAKYTLIYFWDPDCGHCKKETPVLVDFYNKNKLNFDVEVYAVCMDTSFTNMKAYIISNKMNFINVNGFYSVTPDFRELYDVHSSPVMYLLDKNKKIIAKRLLTAGMSDFLEKFTGKNVIK